VSWAVLIPIIATYGLPLAEKLWVKWSMQTPPVAEDWAELNALAAKTARTHLEQALIRNGVALESPKAIELLALVK
jgi:hypothetical protein